MEIQLWSIGKSHEHYIKEGTEDFTKRISNYYPAKWAIISPVKNASAFPAEPLKKKEAEATLALLQKDDCLVALDERGKPFSSADLARFIQSRANESVRKIIFLIGGAYGLDDSVLKRANYRWSLSALTFPHQLVRLILAEQIYRACTINRNEKYHHA